MHPFVIVFSIFLPPRVFWTSFIQETNHKTADSHPYGKKDGVYIEQQGAERANLFFSLFISLVNNSVNFDRW